MTTVESWARFTVVGFHRWPDAPFGRAYLALRHRHRFDFEVGVGVAAGTDREVEYHDLIDLTRSAVRGIWPGGEFGDASCEEIAGRLAGALRSLYGEGRSIRVSVSEDGECGATVTLPGNA